MNHAHLSLVSSRRVSAPAPNGYQKAKARQIAGVLLAACSGSSATLAELPGLVARMNASQWRTVAFQAGQPVPDYPTKLATVAYLIEAAR